MSVHWGGRGPGHLSRWTPAAIAAPTTLAQLKALLAGSAKSGIWTPTDFTTVFTDDGVTQATAGQQFYRANDVSGNGNHLRQATLSRRPFAINGATFDGVDDFLGFTFPGSAGPSNMTVLLGIKTTDTEFCLGSDVSSVGQYFGLGQASSSTVIGNLGSVPVVDGVSFAGQTRAAFASAINNNSWHIAESRSGDFSPMTGIAFANLLSSANYKLNGAMSCMIAIDNTVVADPAAARTVAQQLITQINGEL